MRKRALLIVLLVTAALSGCITAGEEQAPDVMVTHYPIAFLAERIAGSNVTVGIFVEGSQPHDFDPSFEDRRQFSEGQLVVHQGAGFDPWVHDMATSAAEEAPRILTLADTVELLQPGGPHRSDDGGDDEDGGDDRGHDHGHDHDDADQPDAHTWTDPARMIEHAQAMQTAFAETWPEHSEAFANRTTQLVDDLERLDHTFQTALASCEGRTIVVSHNAFVYLADRYNITVESVHGLSPETEPSAETIDRLAQVVEEHNLTTVFFEEFVAGDVIETIAEETGAQARVLSPVAALTEEQRADEETYLTRMEANAEVLAEAMRCTPPTEG